MSSTPGSAGRAMSAGPSISGGYATAFAHAGCRPARASCQVGIPQVREAAEPFVSKLFPRGTKLLRTEPLKALVIGAFVRGLIDARRRVAVREGRARKALEVDRIADLLR